MARSALTATACYLLCRKCERNEDVFIQAFLEQARIEALDVGVLDRLARFDELRPYAMFVGHWSSVRPPQRSREQAPPSYSSTCTNPTIKNPAAGEFSQLPNPLPRVAKSNLPTPPA